MDLINNGQIEPGRCILCQSPHASLMQSIKWLDNQNMQLVRCSSCGLIYLNPRPEQTKMEELYNQPYYTHSIRIGIYERFKSVLLRLLARLHFNYVHLGVNKKFDAFLYWLSKPFKGRWLKIPYYEPDGNLLDIGCGNGDYLVSLHQLGWKCQGTELSEKSAACASARGLDILVGDLLDIKLPAASFDVITLWDVIEHFYDPIRELIQINHSLKIKGTLLIGTPNISSTMFNRFGLHWHGLHFPYHLYLFDPTTISGILQATGFEVITVKLYTSPRGLALDIRSWLSDHLSLSIDKLYKYTYQFDLALLPLTVLLDLFTHGDNMIVWARKVKDLG